jgi:hypothetical protein
MSFRRRAWLAALVWAAAASIPPAVAGGSAGDECGTIGTPPAGTVVVAAGTISCPDATAVVNRYLTDPSVVRDGEWVRFDGWDCWAPSAGEAMMNGFGTECSRGVDNIQIRD